MPMKGDELNGDALVSFGAADPNQIVDGRPFVRLIDSRRRTDDEMYDLTVPRRLLHGADSSNSSRPPSSGAPWSKKPAKHFPTPGG